MFDVGGGELILIVIAILVLFGPKKIPEIAQMVGKGMQQIRKAQAQFQVQINEIKSELDDVGTDHKRNLKNATPVRRDQESVNTEEKGPKTKDEDSSVKSTEKSKDSPSEDYINPFDADVDPEEAKIKDNQSDKR